MKDNMGSWLQLLLSIVALIFSSGSASLLVLFQEHLPQPLYLTLLWVLCLFIIAVLCRLAFGDLIARFRRWVRQKTYHYVRRKRVREWRARWAEMSLLILEVLKTSKKPTQRQNETYHELHNWFIKNRTHVIPIWYSFGMNRTKPAWETYESIVERDVFVEHAEDPFSCFYQPFSLRILLDNMESNYWSLSEIPDALVKLSERSDEFFEWVSSRQ